MIAHRFRSRNPSVPTLLTETGHRHSNPHAGDNAPPAQPPEPAGQSPPLRPMRNAERIAADRQKITESGVLDLLLDHVRGDKELTPSQISTAFGLLNKILPDFSSSAPPRDNEGTLDDGASPDPEFEIHIVDPQET